MKVLVSDVGGLTSDIRIEYASRINDRKLNFPVAIPEGVHPFPSRTRKLSPPGPIVLELKLWESRSLPELILKSTGSSKGNSAFLLFYRQEVFVCTL